MAKNNVKYVCKKCGSDEVCRDATAKWNEDSGAFGNRGKAGQLLSSRFGGRQTFRLPCLGE